MKRSWWVTALAVLIAVAPALAFADASCCSKSAWTQEKTTGDKILQKFYFGVKNTLGGWTEVITQPENALKENKNFVGGVGKGLINAVVDTAGGVLHLGTFFLPQIDIPLPEGGVQL